MVYLNEVKIMDGIELVDVQNERPENEIVGL